MKTTLRMLVSLIAALIFCGAPLAQTTVNQGQGSKTATPWSVSPPPTKRIYSGCDFGGAVLQTPILDLTKFTELSIYFNGLVGSNPPRFMTMVHYQSDGVNQISTTYFGAVGGPNSGTPASFNESVMYLGPYASSEPTGTYLLSYFSEVNTAYNFDVVPGNSRGVTILANCSAGTTTLTVAQYFDDNTTDTTQMFTIPAHASPAAFIGLGTGVGALTTRPAANTGVGTQIVPRRLWIQSSSCGVGNTLKVRVYSYGEAPGVSSTRMILPPKARFSFSDNNDLLCVQIYAR